MFQKVFWTLHHYLWTTLLVCLPVAWSFKKKSQYYKLNSDLTREECRTKPYIKICFSRAEIDTWSWVTSGGGVHHRTIFAWKYRGSHWKCRRDNLRLNLRRQFFMRSQSCKSLCFATLTLWSKQGVTHVHKSLKGAVSRQPFLWTWKDIRTIYCELWNTVSVVNSQILAVHQLINVRLCVVSMKALEPDYQFTKHETDS